MERAFRQAAKHIAAATPAQLSDLLCAWGEMGYTPNDRPFMNELKNDLRRRFKRSDFDGRQLVRLMHGVARWAKYEPNERWLLAFAEQVQPYLGSLPAGGSCGGRQCIIGVPHGATGVDEHACIRIIMHMSFCRLAHMDQCPCSFALTVVSTPGADQRCMILIPCSLS